MSVLVAVTWTYSIHFPRVFRLLSDRKFRISPTVGISFSSVVVPENDNDNVATKTRNLFKISGFSCHIIIFGIDRSYRVTKKIS